MRDFEWNNVLKPARAGKRGLQDDSFATSESGAMTILTLFLIMIVFVASGFAVDVMRYDRERAKLQYALDRAVLAAADLDQELCPKDVVIDYLKKEGLDKYLTGDPKVEPDVCGSTAAVLKGYRRVEANADMDIEMHFMKWRGIETIASAATSVAEESIGNVEISLVLDVSGSMRGSKLENLKKAANLFIDDMFAKTEDGKVSISIVPYSEQVSIPDYLMNKLNTQGTNSIANCVDFASADFATTRFTAFDVTDPVTGIVTPGTTLARTIHHDIGDGSDRRPYNGFVSSTICRPNTSTNHREITILQKDPVALKKEINLLNASGWTSIDVGAKWGVTLLDDSFQPLTKKLVTESKVPSIFKDRPDQNKGYDTMKVMILMTDGENTKQHKVNPPYNHGTSDIWWNADKEKYSVYDREAGNFIWIDVPMAEKHSRRDWYWVRLYRQDHAYGQGTYMQYKCNDYSYGVCHDINFSRSREKKDEGSGAVELSWPALWERTPKGKIYDIFKTAFGTSYANEWYNTSTTVLNQVQKDPRLTSICQKAKDEKIIIFSIAFDAPDGVKPLLKGCVSDDGAYYEAKDNDKDIISVFSSIGSTIQNLRLTQ
ncbi:conserved hypothetical protein [Ruegeria lacuscaerulensis ITI-1157]|nr:conserved hypothetical protein [Ruegeria lacuscaerulensis ITI-1157]SHI55595.1 Flp pilus assembly protein TadG [Ruegeria lacuscaerulensis ITI-1157]